MWLTLIICGENVRPYAGALVEAWGKNWRQEDADWVDNVC